MQPPLMPLVKASQDDHVHVVGYTERDYLELVDWAGRAIRSRNVSACFGHLKYGVKLFLAARNVGKFTAAVASIERSSPSRRPRRCSRRQAQVFENLRNGRGIFDVEGKIAGQPQRQFG